MCTQTHAQTQTQTQTQTYTRTFINTLAHTGKPTRTHARTLTHLQNDTPSLHQRDVVSAEGVVDFTLKISQSVIVIPGGDLTLSPGLKDAAVDGLVGRIATHGARRTCRHNRLYTGDSRLQMLLPLAVQLVLARTPQRT